MFVLDASAAISALFNDGQARELVGAEPMHAPHLIDSEVAHVLRRQVLGNSLNESTGNDLLRTWQNLGISRYPSTNLLPRIWTLKDNLSAYDATYVALAEALDCGLITADARLSRASGVGCPITLVPR